MTLHFRMSGRLAVLAVAGLAGLASAVGFSAPGSAQELQEINVLLPNERTTVFYPAFVGQQLGYFEDEGIKVNLLSSATTVPYVAFLANGSADIAMLDAPQVYQAVDSAQDIAVIYEDMQYAPEALFVSGDSPIKEISELKGQTIGLASDRDRITVEVALNSVGIDISEVETVVVGDAGATLANAFRKNTVAAVAGGTSDMAAVEANGIAIRNITPPAVSENPANSFVVWRPRMEELRPLVTKFLRAWAKAAAAAPLDMDVAAAMLKQDIPEQWEDRAVGMKLLDRTANLLHKPLTEKRGDLQPAVWTRVQAPYIKLKEISKELDPATFLDNSFIAEINTFDEEAIKADLAEWKAANADKMQ